MAVNFAQKPESIAPDRFMLVGVAFMALTAIVALFFLAVANGALDAYPYLFLLPWIFGLAIVMAIPAAILHYQGKFSFADPLIFATWSYFFPAFVIGGVFLASGWSQPYFLEFIQDPKYNLPLTIVLVALGFGGLSLGYLLPIGEKVGSMIERILPKAEHPIGSYGIPGIALLIIGIFNTIAAFAMGLFGYQRANEINSYDGLIYVTTIFWTQGSFLLWNVLFRQRRLTILNIVILVLLVTTAVSKSLFAGNRGNLLATFIIVALAYVLAGRQLKVKQTVGAGMVLSLFLVVGMIYGTTFRIIKGSEDTQGVSGYADNIVQTLDQVSRKDTVDLLQFSFSSMTERIDIVSTLGVVVSNYEELAPYEEAYGLDNNIWQDLTTFFIPRIIWKDKPYASNPRKYGDLYFNYGDSAFAITPIGDLLRNFGIIGVPIGMFVLGLILRIIYRTLVENQPLIIWRTTLYFMLLLAVSYESFYGTMIPFLVKGGFTAALGILFVNFLAKRMSRPDEALRA
jgi:hypothetical protein